MIKLSKDIWHYPLNYNMAMTSEYLPSILNTVADREKNQTLQSGFFIPKFFKFFGFSTTRFSNNKSICFAPMLPTTSIYILTSRSLQSGERCNDTKLEHRSPLCISPFQYYFKSAPKNKRGMCSSSDLDCTSLEYQTMVPRILKPLCQGTSAAATGTRNSDKIKKYCTSIDGGELIDTSGLVGLEKPFV